MRKAAMVGAVLLLGVGVVVFAFALGADRANKSTGHDIIGSMSLGDFESGPTTCWGEGGYGDIKQGAPVTVKDEKGTLIGSGSLGSGTMQGQVGSRRCVFPFVVAAVKDADFYQVEVSRRGGLTYSKADLAAAGWKVEASLG